MKKIFLALSFLFIIENKALSFNYKNFLLESGFENVYVKEDKEEIILSYENRTFLYEINALGYILSKIPNTDKKVSFYIQSNGNQILALKLYYKDYIDFINNKITQEEFSSKLEMEQNPKIIINKFENNLFLHTDLVISPSYYFFQKEGPTIYFSPYVNILFNNGFSFSSRYSFPIYNIVNSFDLEKNLKQFPATFLYNYFDYSIPIDNLPLWITLRAGHNGNGFSNNLLISNDIKYNLLDGWFNLNLSSGLIYNINTNKTDFHFTPYGQFYWGNLDLVLESGAGKFLNNDYGFWGRITRQFDFSDIGFSLYRVINQGKGEWRFNFEYNIAIGTEPSPKASNFRIIYPRFHKGFLYAGSGGGNSVSFYSNELFIKRLYPEYIKTHLYFFKKYK
ncbi:MAG: hypothetical protein KatS3mg068_2016 [Candidatus Sericytochromatia bacterium]|nr:MAG: hypothetical protein KatS3mg068_2016 [Candidatus Sericytochromatia bacterium]